MIRMRNPLLVMLGTLLACASGAAFADAPAKPAAGDVTMTVIPSGVDVVKSVVQNISVPANADKVAKAKGAEPRKAAGQDSETAQQLAEAAAERQAGQTQQQVQQAQIAARAKISPPPPPPPPPKPPARS